MVSPQGGAAAAGSGDALGGAGGGSDVVEGGARDGAGGATAGAGGVPATSLGGGPDALGGAGGAADCASPQSVTGTVTADTWIEAANPTISHGSDKTLSVVSGGAERRALLQLALPALP